MAVEAKNIPTVQIADGCAVNVKGAKLVESNIGIPSTFSICNTHIAHGAIRRGTCVSKSKSHGMIWIVMGIELPKLQQIRPKML